MNRPRPGWLPTRREIAVVLLAALLGGLLGLATRPDRSIRRDGLGPAAAATSTEVASKEAEVAGSPAGGVGSGGSSVGGVGSGGRGPADGGTTAGGRTSAVTALSGAAAATPVALTMPVLGVFGAVVDAVGVAADGSLSVPPGDRIGWYRFGGRPGGNGTVVLAAHVAWGGEAGVFAGLVGLQAGDRLELAGADGAVGDWVVTERRSYAKAQLPVGELFRTAGPSQLVLITCGGAIDPVRGSYGDNVVILASPAT